MGRMKLSKKGRLKIMGNKPQRVAIYARVSTDDKGQDPENQLRELRTWCENSECEIIGEYIDFMSGTVGVGKRKEFTRLFKEFTRLFEDAAKRRFDLVLFWALDRFSREGLSDVVLHLRRLDSHGVGFHSYTEEFLNTDNELSRDILLAVFASLAKVESAKISDRTKAGLARARASGKKLGRPRVVDKHLQTINRLHAEGHSIRGISKEIGIGYNTVWRAVNL